MKLKLAFMGVLAWVAAAQPAGEQVGSLRGARVAHAMPEGRREALTYFAGRLTEAQVSELKGLAPDLTVVNGLSREEALARAGEADGVDVAYASPEFIAKSPKLVWVQAMSAGVDSLQRNRPLMDTERIVLTNMRAVHGPAIADHAMAMLLTLTRGLRHYEKGQEAGKWDESGPEPRPVALAGRTMLVVGIGGIGTEIGQRAHGFRMRVIATRRSDAPAPEYVEKVGKPGDLFAMLPEADVVAVCVPLTTETQGLFGEKEFGAMKKGAFLINIARGKIVRTEALVEALKSGKLAGACLDVTDPEPLPAGHELWGMKNVVITPHTAADAELTEERRWALFKENMRRFGAGEPLLNCVDKKAGY